MSLARALLVALGFALLFLPFKGISGALWMFGVLAVSIPAFKGLGRLASRRTFRLPLVPKVNPMVLYAATLASLLCVPLVAGGYVIDVLVLACIYVILAEGLNVVVGFSGMLSLGFVAFYAIGAYAYALLTTDAGIGFWVAMPVSAVVAALAGGLLALPALRLRGDYLALVTLGFGEIVRLVLNNWDSVTHGPNGISGIPRPALAGFGLDRLEHYYYLALMMVVVSLAVIRNVRESKIGRAWVAIREDEIAASASGINTLLYKFYANAFGAFFAGLAGVLYAAKMQFISPESFSFFESVIVLCMVILGGLGSITGVVLGATLLVVLPEMLRDVQAYRMLVLGAGLVALMIFRPQGIMGRRHAS